MKKPVILITKPESLGELSALQKAHVKGYTRSDGTFVKEHDTSVTAKPKAASPSANKFPGEKNGPSDASLKQFAQTDTKAKAKLDKQEADKKYGHPNVVGHAENLKGGDASKAHGMHFAGKEYIASGKEGKSMHDDTPVRHFTEVTGAGDDDGQHVWMDHSGRVHADDTSSVKRLRGDYESHKAKSGAKSSAAKPKAGG